MGDLKQIGFRRVNFMTAAPTTLTAGVHARSTLVDRYAPFPLYEGLQLPCFGFTMIFFGVTNDQVGVCKLWAVEGFYGTGNPPGAKNPYDSVSCIVRPIGVTGNITVGTMAGLDKANGAVKTTELFADTIASWTDDATYQTPLVTAFSAGTAAAISPTNNLIARLIIPEIGEADAIIAEFTTVPAAGIGAAILPHRSRADAGK